MVTLRHTSPTSHWVKGIVPSESGNAYSLDVVRARNRWLPGGGQGVGGRLVLSFVDLRSSCSVFIEHKWAYSPWYMLHRGRFTGGKWVIASLG